MDQRFEDKYLEILASSPYIQAVARPNARITRLEEYCYAITLQTLNLNAPVTGFIQTLSDSDFVVDYMSAAAQLTANTAMTFDKNIAVQIQDQSTGKFFFNQATVMGNVFGAAGFPFITPAPRVLNPNTPLAVTATNRDTTQNYANLYVAFHGRRIFYA